MSAAPRRLRKDPIILAVAEFRFKPAQPQGASAVLPGHYFPKYKDRFPRLVAQPIAQLPVSIRAADETLKYATLHHLVGERCALMLGDRTLAVSIDAPYPGWDGFKAFVAPIWRHGEQSGVIGEIERVSVKYVNLLEGTPNGDHFALTSVKLSLGDKVLTSEPTQIRTEMRDGPLTTIIELVLQATASNKSDGSVRQGAMVAVDAILNGPLPDFWTGMDRHLDRIHAAEKDAFFRLLSAETLQRYEPEY